MQSTKPSAPLSTVKRTRKRKQQNKTPLLIHPGSGMPYSSLISSGCCSWLMFSLTFKRRETVFNWQSIAVSQNPYHFGSSGFKTVNPEPFITSAMYYIGSSQAAKAKRRSKRCIGAFSAVPPAFPELALSFLCLLFWKPARCNSRRPRLNGCASATFPLEAKALLINRKAASL